MANDDTLKNSAENIVEYCSPHLPASHHEHEHHDHRHQNHHHHNHHLRSTISQLCTKVGGTPVVRENRAFCRWILYNAHVDVVDDGDVKEGEKEGDEGDGEAGDGDHLKPPGLSLAFLGADTRWTPMVRPSSNWWVNLTCSVLNELDEHCS